MKNTAIFVLIYGLIILCGGMIGYKQAHSLPSLIMGTSFAVLLIMSALAIFKEYILGYFSAILLTAILACFFTYRYFLTHKFMPAGMMMTLSLILLSFFLFRKLKSAVKS